MCLIKIRLQQNPFCTTLHVQHCTRLARSSRWGGLPLNDMTLPRSGTSVSARPEGWLAQMIHPLADHGVGQAGSFVSKTFELSEVRGSETLAITAWGLYRASINGRRVGQDVLTPGWTNYDARLAVQEYDVADLLTVGTNTIEISTSRQLLGGTVGVNTSTPVASVNAVRTI
jgi:hypothetical protein